MLVPLRRPSPASDVTTQFALIDLKIPAENDRLPRSRPIPREGRRRRCDKIVTQMERLYRLFVAERRQRGSRFPTYDGGVLSLS
jgi:hypothetical protein